jgi:hypothetical protein
VTCCDRLESNQTESKSNKDFVVFGGDAQQRHDDCNSQTSCEAGRGEGRTYLEDEFVGACRG